MTPHPSKWPLSGAGNAVVGTLVAALITLFAFLNGIPWEAKGAVAQLRGELQRELGDIKLDIREIRRIMERREHRDTIP